MIVLDTNVLSELMRPSPHSTVVEWMDSRPADEFSTTAITAAELLHGVGRLPAGRRKSRLTTAVHALLHDDLQGRIEPFDGSAAEVYAQVVTHRESLGRPIGVAGAQIAAICRAHDASLATRNIKDFDDIGVELIDPWSGN